MAIRKVLLSLLGEKRYLSLLAGTFQRIYRTGRLGSSYQDIYFLKNMIEEGAYCADIGAHLGYYTLELSRLVKDSGRVIAIEPMPLFNATLGRLLQRRKRSNVELLQIALGGKGEYVEMGIPRIGGTARFAYARVTDGSAGLQYATTVKVKNEQGDHLFKSLPRLDFIKCDVEGLEVQVFSSMPDTLRIHHPILLCELGDKGERIKFFELAGPLGYRCYRLLEGRLHPLDVYSDQVAISHNHYFIPPVHEARLRAAGLIAE